MTQQLAELLRGWRTRRGLSLGGLAERAGLSKGTLSGWERGLHQPRLVELEAVLDVLKVPLSHRQAALALIDAPRARRALALTAPTVSAGPHALAQPVPGHLLQAMRRRRGLTLDAVALAVGVDRANVSRWERSVSTPSAERLARLLDLLGAEPEERLALTTGQRLLLPLSAGRPTPLEELEQRWEEIARRVTFGDRRLLELEFLAWQAAIWPLAARSEAARQSLGGALASYAEWLTWDGRWQEAGTAAERALDLLQTTDRRTRAFIGGMQCTVQVCARVVGQSKALNARIAAVERLRVWLPAAGGGEWHVDLYRHLAPQAWWAGQPEAAAAFGDRSCALAERLGDERLWHWCRLGRVDIYLRSGQTQEALALLSPPNPNAPPYGKINDRLLWARAMHAVGEKTAADWLSEAYALIDEHGYAPLRAEADELSRLF
jgi:transcriptional regulator with XRE-family HTH domain